jgi:hypothetical protein
MKISICHPSRERPQIAYETALAWLTLSGDLAFNVDYWLAVEVGEASLYAPVVERLQNQFGSRFRVRFVDGKRVTLEELYQPEFIFPTAEELGGYLTPTTKMNTLIRECGSDWIVGVADNFLPPPNWYELMSDTFQKHLGTPAVVGYPYEKHRLMISHPIITKEFFVQNGNSIFYPDYYHTHADVDLFLLASLTKILYFLPDGVDPIHRHPYHDPTVAEDALCRLNNSKKTYAQGEEVWVRRKTELTEKHGS